MLAQVAEVDVVLEEGRLWLSIPNHGRKWLHPLSLGGETVANRFFVKDATGTTARFSSSANGSSTLVLESGDLRFTLTRAD